MTNFKKLKNADYRILKRSEATTINGGFGEPNCNGPCGPIRCACEQSCGDNYSFCFHNCVTNAGCPI
ncbi:hypothetical protein [Aquimarina algicola]|uniref:Uncharacterized protein n=1 Tax=Aquimarina algicola TaxID=2589995 RepID=A0A504IT94_9FLAO|nr:hypothetical protein [Aquimarina algicola]TPN81697.1 hypothetical protein FHK87_24165 [Aquimarina algicola]